MARPKKFPDEVMERAVRLALESERPIAHVAHDFGMHPETLRKKVRQAEADSGKRPELLSSQEREEIRRLRRENYELRRANEILKSASVFSPRSSTQTDRSEPLHRRASRPFRGRADLPDLGRVGVRLLPAPDRRPLAALA
jgi:transposase